MITTSVETQTVELSNEEYLKNVMNRYGTQLKRYAYMMVKDQHLAEDVVQKTFINFYYSIDNYRHDSSEKNYLYTILANECRQIRRKNWFRRENRNNYEDVKNAFQYNEDYSIDKIAVADCLAKIKPKYREIIILYYYQNFSVADISEILNLTNSAVKSRLKYARDNIKRYLEEVFVNE
ncbi:RNA polymerase sigma factor [Vallitalea sp.]|jgi:RNA polymerase sigma-70 factor (ECF subfamily)|uniref:RNA polymerase sigma factor n=1 Tax=Vallitalea sp. TaxID=1882829 RepID=UPI0025D3A586|nr:RNA polymerase sigma factor [Vallitalea sp.]MCT4688951.1 RNA polymerase sigma factor [Vallitalea sp.]